MRYIVSIAAALLVLLLLSATTGFGDWPRPWGPLSRGAVGGIIAIGVLIIWEQLYPREDSLTEEEKERIALEDAQGVGVVNTISGDSAGPITNGGVAEDAEPTAAVGESVTDEFAFDDSASASVDDAAPAPADDEDPRA